MDVITFGETMAVFSPNQSGKLRYASQYSRNYAGAESNVAIGLSNLGIKVSWISQLGEDEFGEAIHSFIAGHHIDTSNVIHTSKAPTGVMFKEYRNSDNMNVYYYRKNSAFSLITKEYIKESVFKDAKILHLTGITPLLSDSAYEACLTCIKYAKANNIKVIFDPNIRMKLVEDKNDLNKLKNIALQSDYFLPNILEVNMLFELHTEEPMIILDKLKEFAIPNVILKNGINGTYYLTENETGFVQSYQVKEVDPIGAGDAFAAGLIFGIVKNESLEIAVKRGNAMGAYAVMVKGDIENLPDLAELNLFMGNKKRLDNVNR